MVFALIEYASSSSSNDPEFAAKLHDIVGLYVNPPDHAIVLSVDEKSQIQALDRTQPGLPMKKGRVGTMTHDYNTNAMAQRRCLPPSMCSTAPSSAATCSTTGTRSSSASSTPPRRRCRCEWRSTPSSTTTRPTNIPRYKNGWPGIPAGRFTSRLPRRPGSQEGLEFRRRHLAAAHRKITVLSGSEPRDMAGDRNVPGRICKDHLGPLV